MGWLFSFLLSIFLLGVLGGGIFFWGAGKGTLCRRCHDWSRAESVLSLIL